MQKMTNVFIINISMRKMILEVEYSKSMIYEILKIFRRITYFMILTHLFRFRDGPLEKLWGGGRGIFEPQEFFFVIKFLVSIFFRP